MKEIETDRIVDTVEQVPSIQKGHEGDTARVEVAPCPTGDGHKESGRAAPAGKEEVRGGPAATEDLSHMASEAHKSESKQSQALNETGAESWIPQKMADAVNAWFGQDEMHRLAEASKWIRRAIVYIRQVEGISGGYGPFKAISVNADGVLLCVNNWMGDESEPSSVDWETCSIPKSYLCDPDLEQDQLGRKILALDWTGVGSVRVCRMPKENPFKAHPDGEGNTSQTQCEKQSHGANADGQQARMPSWDKSDPSGSLRRLALWFNDEARGTFLKDASHSELYFLISQDGQQTMIQPPEDIDREALHLGLRSAVRKNNTYGVIQIAECWHHPLKRPTDRPRKQVAEGETAGSRQALCEEEEALIVRMECRDGTQGMWNNVIIRAKTGVLLEDPVEISEKTKRQHGSLFSDLAG